MIQIAPVQSLWALLITPCFWLPNQELMNQKFGRPEKAAIR